MKMISLLLFLLIQISSFSQNKVLVPYRVGDKFGISDLEGKLVYPAEYDNITIKRGDPVGVFYAKKENKTTFFYNNKIFIKDSKYNVFQVLENRCVLAKTDLEYLNISDFKNETEYKAAKKRTRYISIYNLKGENCYPENFKELHILDTAGHSDINKSLSRYIAFISLNFDEKTSIFIYDCDLQKITEWLIKDYFAFKFTGSNKDFTSQKTEIDKEEKYTLIFDGNKFNIKQLDTKSLVGPHQYGSASNSDKSSKKLDRANNPFNDSFDGGIVETVNNSDKPQQRIIKSLFKIKEGRIFQYLCEYKKDTIIKEIKLPYSMDDLKIENYCYFENQDSNNLINYEFHNLIVVKSNNKYGVLISDKIQIQPIYDTISMILSTNYNDSKTSICFLVGIKNSVSKNMLFGTIDIHTKTIIPIVYEQINYNRLEVKDSDEDEKYNKRYKVVKFCTTTYNKEWLIKKEGKYGFISPTDSIILKPEYDEITQNGNVYSSFFSDFKILKKGNLYGVMYNKDNVLKIIEPIFPYKPDYLVENYQGVKGKLLFRLVDDTVDPDNFMDKFFCFAEENGHLYFREK